MELIDPPALQVEAAAGSIRRLLQGGEHARALSAAKALLAEAPQDRELLYMTAVGQRYLNQVPEALATLGRLECLHPRFSRLFQERGHCYIALRCPDKAIESFERAVQLCAALPGSWQALRALYRMADRAQDSETAAAHVRKLATLPPDIVTASAMFADGDVYEAERLVRQYLLTHGDHIEGMRLLAKIGIELDILDDAEVLLAGALALAPDYHAARYDYAVVLLKRHKHVRAQQEIARLLALEPHNRVYRTTQAAIAMGLGDYGRALPLYSELLAQTPDDPSLQLSVAHALKTLGRTQEAIGYYRAATDGRSDYGEAYWSLANLKTYRFSAQELAQMRAREDAGDVALSERYHLCFALGKAFEDRGDYGGSFAYYARGNELKKTECRYRPQITETNARLQSAVCTREFLAARAGFGCDSDAPIFIVGLPRSGSTLLEQILASHSRVEGTMELAEIPRLAQDLNGRAHNDASPLYPGVLHELAPGDLRRYGEQYLADTCVYRTARKALFIDKNPNNFRHIGLIHLILPNARIIDARREAMACCVGNYKQLFASGQQFTYSIDHLARYYRSYVELMEHWERALPGKILRIWHEDLVNDLETVVRRILEFCNLAFEPACLSFHRTERSVHTASSEQVRQPIYREGLDHWRHFEPWLGPLRASLGSLALPRAPGPQPDEERV